MRSLYAMVAAVFLMPGLACPGVAFANSPKAMKPTIAMADSGIPSFATVIPRAGNSPAIATWSEQGESWFAIQDSQKQWQVVGPTSYDLRLRYSQFDPQVQSPDVPQWLQSTGFESTESGVLPDEIVYIIQFQTQPLPSYRADIKAAGGIIHKFLAQHAYLVRLNAQAYTAVTQLPYVRWVGVYQPAYKLESELFDAMQSAKSKNINTNLPPIRVNVMVFERGPRQKNIVADHIVALGGQIDSLTPNGFRLEATIDGDQLIGVAQMPEVMWIDRWTEQELDMDIAREIGGANHLEKIAGYTGQGVRGEVFDNNLFSSHVDFQNSPPIFHGNHLGDDDHGTGTYGIVFGDGTGNFNGRGMLPDAQGIFADNGQFSDRYQHTAELLEPPYEAVFQSNSWGNGVTSQYNSISAEMDDIIFINDIVITQSQSNQDSTLSRPQAWAKNIVSIGGIRHVDTLTRDDDFWSGASIGPAQDGRIKPDLSHFYDLTFTTDDTPGGYRNFGGTSGATPIVAGHFGIFFQMWSAGIFGNLVDPTGSVFENRPHATTAKAMLINHASSYPFSGTTANLTRTHQGWGLPDLTRLHDRRNSTFIVNEELVLENSESAVFQVNVDPDTDELRATMVYMDLMGTTSSNLHRINDLTLMVSAPSGTVYWGNNGLAAGNWSVPGGSPNTVDTVENVLIQNPEAGTWSVTVIASEINEDAHLETPEFDADFALVVSGIAVEDNTLDELILLAGLQEQGDLADLAVSDDQYLELVADPMMAPQETPVQIQISGTLGNANPSQLSISLEARVNTVGLAQTIEMFNFNTGEYEEVDTQDGFFGSDQQIAVDISSGISDYVESGSGQVRAGIGWRSSGLVLFYPWSVFVDQFRFITN